MKIDLQFMLDAVERQFVYAAQRAAWRANATGDRRRAEKWQELVDRAEAAETAEDNTRAMAEIRRALEEG